MARHWTRRAFVQEVLGLGAIAAGLAASARVRPARADEGEPPRAPDHTLTVIRGTPRERGRQYGRSFRGPLETFLDREIYAAFVRPRATNREAMLRYAGQCGKAIRDFSPMIWDELEGMAEGSGRRIEEVVLITLHEELYHRGVLPSVDHCTAIAAGPPNTNDGHTYVGQTWDWMTSVYGMSSMLLWRRTEGPSLLAYAYPGLWVGAGLNSAGIALCWTSAGGPGFPGPRVGIPSYVLIAQMLYQDTLDGALSEARRATQAGWFTFVLADGDGRLVNVEGSPSELIVEPGRGHLVRVGYGSREMTHTAAGQTVQYHPQCRRMNELLDGARGKLDRALLQGFFGDHRSTICKHFGTLDAMLFDTTTSTAYVSRGPGCSGRWQRFGFDEA
jgi:isopenicillin-N N-acyltransferase-like protein